MSDPLSIGQCEKCSKTLVPEDFNLHGAIRLPDDRFICKPCADGAQDAALRSSQIPRRGDTGIFRLEDIKAHKEPHKISIGCMECVEVCPQKDCLSLVAPAGKRLPIAIMPVAVVVVFGIFYVTALFTGHWHTTMPPDVLKPLYRAAETFAHP